MSKNNPTVKTADEVKVDNPKPLQSSQSSQSSVQMQMVQQTQSGPLPSSSEFSNYEVAVAGAGERILAMAEKEQAHRIETEKEELALMKRQIDENVKIEHRKLDHANKGMNFAFITMLALLASAVYLVKEGHEIYGAMAGISVAVVAYFIGGKDYLIKDKSKKEDKQDAPDA